MKFNKVFLILLLACMNIDSARAEDDFLDSIDDISFEDLGNIVTSVSKKPESAFEAASSIYVITDEDIRRMGALSFQEVLRIVPGLQVSKVDANKWAISSRGFNKVLSNKLLVLMDGRSVYSPTFSGVYWDVLDYPLEDIKRIEVIRGPGAALWGANAVNGVINIITKRAIETQGSLVSGVAGNKHVGEEGVVRYGGHINENVHYRIYAKGASKGDLVLENGEDSYTAWNHERSGFRIDAEAGASSYFTLQGDVYHNKVNRRTVPAAAVPQAEIFHTDNSGGGNLLARWHHKFEDGSNVELQAYFDSARKDHILLEQSNNTFDIDFKHNFMINSDNDFTWGGNYRSVLSKFENSSNYVFTPTKRTDNLYSLFVQNKFTVIPNEVFVVVGSKLEHNDFTGFEVQPNIRASWQIDSNNTLWGAVSRAVRTPSIGEDGIELVNGPSGLGGVAKLIGTENYDSEDLISYEIGYRSNINDKLSVDSTIFYNDYNNLFSLSSPVIDGNDILFYGENLGKAKIYGFEVLANYNVTDDLWLEGSYSFIELDLDVDSTNDREAGYTPKNQIKASINYNVTKELEWNNIFYYTDNLETIGVTAHTRYDSNIIWKPKQGVEFSLVGQNLLDSNHKEYTASGNTIGVPAEVERSVYGKVTLRF